MARIQPEFSWFSPLLWEGGDQPRTQDNRRGAALGASCPGEAPLPAFGLVASASLLPWRSDFQGPRPTLGIAGRQRHPFPATERRGVGESNHLEV